MVNEDTADLRVFMNQADGTGLLAPFGESTYAVGNRASPSEAHDFDRDGNTDITVANINDSTVSVLLGNGDGSYAPQQVIPVGMTPRGIAVLDVEGDGDTDIVNTNYDSDNLSLLLNDGSGKFREATFFDGGVAGEWSLMAGDMNNDGIISFDECELTDEEIGLILDTTAASTFNFLSYDIGSGSHTIEAYARLSYSGEVVLGDGSAKASASLGKGTLSVWEVHGSISN